jgi:1-acyl-sn-glycerol-3-phosphate acyltransferase
MISQFGFKIICGISRCVLFLWHPVFRVYGRENVPQDGPLLICPNHSGMADPFWVVFAIRPRQRMRFMAKKEAMDTPVIGAILRWLGVFGVDRGGADVNAIKTGLKSLKNGHMLLVFPEGTRVRKGKIVEAKAGAVLLSNRTGTPILPVYVSPRKAPFSPVTCVIGKPVLPEFDDKRPKEAELQAAAQQIMNDTYELRKQACR